MPELLKADTALNAPTLDVKAQLALPFEGICIVPVRVFPPLLAYQTSHDMPRTE